MMTATKPQKLIKGSGRWWGKHYCENCGLVWNKPYELDKDLKGPYIQHNRFIGDIIPGTCYSFLLCKKCETIIVGK